jgi:hypothetical protein
MAKPEQNPEEIRIVRAVVEQPEGRNLLENERMTAENGYP